jgi:hypothetical protein
VADAVIEAETSHLVAASWAIIWHAPKVRKSPHLSRNGAMLSSRTLDILNLLHLGIEKSMRQHLNRAA